MISVIIPTLNEAETLPETLAHLRRNDTAHETLVADARSTDRTIEAAEAAHCQIITADQPHRAKQMNLGATRARGEILFFLHADTLIDSTALQQIDMVLADPQVVGGGFTRRYRGAPAFLRFTCAMADVRCRWLGWFLGDQGIFVRRPAFEQLGGFQEMPLFEDLDLCRRLKRNGKLVCLGPPVMSSARRFARRGAVFTSLFDAWLTLRYLAGTNPERLARWRCAQNRRGKKKPSAASYA